MNIINPQIFITAAITFILSAGIWGGLFYGIGLKRPILIGFAAALLPFSALINLLVKAPLNRFVVSSFYLEPGIDFSQPILYLIFLALLAPITEELVKILLYIFPSVRKLNKEHALWIGAWCGLGFGLGEALYLGWGIAKSSQFADLPWYAFGGYMGERLAVCLVHAVMTALFFVYLKNRKPLLGFVLVVTLHLLVNAGAIFYALDVFPIWGASLSLWVMILVMVFLFEKERKTWSQTVHPPPLSSEVIYFRRED